MRARIYTDGGSRGNPGPAAYAVIISDENDRIVREFAAYLGRATNNEAEYRGLIAGLREAEGIEAKEISVVMDSEVVVKQMTGEYRVKAGNLSPLHREAKERMRRFEDSAIEHVEREHPMIVRADGLVNEELDRHVGYRK